MNNYIKNFWWWVVIFLLFSLLYSISFFNFIKNKGVSFIVFLIGYVKCLLYYIIIIFYKNFFIYRLFIFV